jgi:excinuclease ABC subunit A
MKIILKKVKVHNLKNVSLELEPNQLIVFSGVSGSGKSSLAFDTIYAEGQRRYIESLSTYAKRQLGDLPKPEAELISGISPTIAIEQKTAGKNPRSTVGTMTGIYDYMRVLFARVGVPHCPISGEKVLPQSSLQIIHAIQAMPPKDKLILLSPYAKGKKGEFKDDFAELLRQGFTRLRLDGHFVEITESLSLDKKASHDIDLVIDRITPKDKERIQEGVTRALESGKGVMSVWNVTAEEETLFSQHAYAFKSGKSYPPLEPHDFSFNHPSGMCPECQGMGVILEFKLDLIIDPNLSIAEDCCSIAPSYKTVRYGNIYNNLAKIYKFSIDTPWKDLPEKGKEAFLHGIDAKWTKMEFVHPIKQTRWTDYIRWQGVITEAKKRYAEATSDTYRSNMHALMEKSVCSSCKGARIKAYPAATLLGEKSIAEVSELPVEEALHFFETITPNLISEELLKEVIQRLHFLMGVGLHYLTLDRTAPTLSGGEAQRVRLASQIGSGLVGTTYILDEPSIGLHPRDNLKLIETLKRLRDKGNTVIVVEHDEETLREADHIVDFGPLAGDKGGSILVSGTLKDLMNTQESLTGAYLSGRLSIPIPKKRRAHEKGVITLTKASHHNLKGIDVSFPLGVLIAIAGVSGSGKSSLISDTLYPLLSNHLHHAKLPCGAHRTIKGLDLVDKVIAIDQAPIGRTPRSNPSTYIKLFDEIRDLFSQLPESIAFGYKPGRFSFNVKEGSCPHCEGMGMTKIDMDFMEDEWVSCEHCKGKRFDTKTLSVLFRGKTIHDVLEMSVSEALVFFEAIPSIKNKLMTLEKVGLEYLKLGQASPTLSGGEAQRIKLAKELSRPCTGKTLYILDEPTTGLHFHDINKLVAILQSLVDKGNTVIVIEHNIDLIKTADWIIELGPEGGAQGGKLLAEGTPEKFLKLSTPTGIALKAPKDLNKKRIGKQAAAVTAITVQGACQNNLKNITTSLPRGQITVCTGPSGSGKTSFAFETIYAEGQRRYIESLSLYARQLVKQMPKPKVESIEGLSPAIAIEQKNHAGNPRSTIGTMTEAYDFLRVLYAHLGTPYAPETGNEIRSISKDHVVSNLLELPEGTKLHVLSPLALKKSETFEELKERLQKLGFLRIRLNGQYFELEDTISFDKKGKNTLFVVIDRIAVKKETKKRLFEAVDQAATFSSGTLTVDAEGKDLFFNLAFADPSSGKSYPAITPHSFSFNTDQGMCPDCLGLGFQYGLDLSQVKELLKMTPLSIMRLLWKEHTTPAALTLFIDTLEEAGINLRLPILKQPPTHLQLFFNGKIMLKKKGLSFEWQGINPMLAKAAKTITELREPLLPLLSQITCLSCGGSRLQPLARHVKLDGVTIAEFCSFPLLKALDFALSLNPPEFLKDTYDQLIHRLQFLKEIGLGYLSLDRSAPTLSGGETQRIRLSRQLGSGLTGCLYVLDEPSIGLHPHDNSLVNKALLHLRNMGNTLLLVEHDPLTIEIADYILDFGPGAGKDGGKITAQGTLAEIKKDPHSLTGAYLSHRKTIPLPPARRKAKTTYPLKNCTLHNLKNISLNIPIGVFTCFTGVSGSGKSTLMHDILKPSVEKALASKTDKCPFDKLIAIDQTPLGQTNRADVTTYTEMSAPLRALFASLPAAHIKGLQPKHFSANHRKGMCPVCFGLGTKSVQLQFLPPVKVPCDTCQGFRLNPLSLEVRFKEKNFGEILAMTVIEAKQFLGAIPKIAKLLDILISVGLGYLKLGQEIASLSGGEQQRIRLSRELARRSSGKTLYLFDEPTIGLHSDDIAKLLPIFHALVDRGNTLILIEHNLDIIAHADMIFDLGPGAGDKGGQIVAQGTPEEIIKQPHSFTAQHLIPFIKNNL